MKALPPEAVRYNLDTCERLVRTVMAALGEDSPDVMLLLQDVLFYKPSQHEPSVSLGLLHLSWTVAFFCSQVAKTKSMIGALNAKKNVFNMIVSNTYIPSVKSFELQPLSSMYPYWQVEQSVEKTAALFRALPQDRCAFLVCPSETGVKQKCNIGT